MKVVGWVLLIFSITMLGVGVGAMSDGKEQAAVAAFWVGGSVFLTWAIGQASVWLARETD